MVWRQVHGELLGPLGAAVAPAGSTQRAHDLDEAVNARLARQTLLDDPSKRFELVMGETALRRVLIPLAAMRPSWTDSLI